MDYIKPAFNPGDVVCLKNTVTHKHLNNYGIPTDVCYNYSAVYYIVALTAYSSSAGGYTCLLIPMGFMEDGMSNLYKKPNKWYYKESWLQKLSEESLSESVKNNINEKYFKIEKYYLTNPSSNRNRTLWKIYGAVYYLGKYIVLYEKISKDSLYVNSNKKYKRTRLNDMIVRKDITYTEKEIVTQFSYQLGCKLYSIRHPSQ